MRTNPEKPTCVSILICDAVYRDETTKKLIVVGIFNRLTASEIPCRHPRMTVLFTITNARGEYKLVLTIEHEKTGQKVVEIGGPLKVDDPLMISDINMELRNLTFPEEGKYWVVLKADEEILQQRPFWVQLATQREAK